MKKILLILLFIANLYGEIEISQNIKALYKGVELTEVQEDYILDNQDINSEILKRVLNQDIKNLKLKYLDEKNVISFILTPSGEVKDIKLLQESNNSKLNRLTKQAINKAASKFIKPKEETNIRFIISYRVGQSQKSNKYQTQTEARNRPYYQNIPRGTTRFEHSSDEYVKTFETSRDGFINLSVSPQLCMERATLLTDKGQRIKITSMYMMYMNEEIPKGKYKILFKTKKTCNVNLEYQ